jgi:hypothetical protein
MIDPHDQPAPPTPQDLANADAQAFLKANKLASDTQSKSDSRFTSARPVIEKSLVPVIFFGLAAAMAAIFCIAAILSFTKPAVVQGSPSPSPSTLGVPSFSGSSDPNTQIQQDEKACSNPLNAALGC